MKTLTLSLLTIAGSILLLSFVIVQKPWDVPAEYKTMQNPVKKTDKVMAQGKTLYKQSCAGCHGDSGTGDGIKVKKGGNLAPASLIIDKSKNESDGVHFFKIKYGRGVGNLHSFKGMLDDEEIWAIIHYIKILG
jgi:mono/diheme cytochrome c family protein